MSLIDIAIVALVITGLISLILAVFGSTESDHNKFAVAIGVFIYSAFSIQIIFWVTVLVILGVDMLFTHVAAK